MAGHRALAGHRDRERTRYGRKTLWFVEGRLLIALALWTGAVLGVGAVIAAVLRPLQRRLLLLVAAGLFLPIGIFGILSIGVVFLAAALACVVFALMSSRTTNVA